MPAARLVEGINGFMSYLYCPLRSCSGQSNTNRTGANFAKNANLVFSISSSFLFRIGVHQVIESVVFASKGIKERGGKGQD
jgi:hypothetical protein